MLQPPPCLEQGLIAPHLLWGRLDTSPPSGWKEHPVTPQVRLAGGQKAPHNPGDTRLPPAAPRPHSLPATWAG